MSSGGVWPILTTQVTLDQMIFKRRTKMEMSKPELRCSHSSDQDLSTATNCQVPGMDQSGEKYFYTFLEFVSY